jgi:hypothetical protein
MAYIDDYTLSQDATFQERIRMSMIKAAITVMGAAPSADATVDRLRTVLATNVLNNPNIYIQIFTFAAIEVTSLVATSTDGQMDIAVAAVWNSIAGVTTRD